MQIYRVGGSVRDELLGLPVNDADWVVVGATPQQMLDLGYRAVGKDFPVFLHPDTHEEYALARTERKTAPGYRGFAVHFAPDVSLQDDLLRRDLTINAMARANDGALIDPHGGLADLRAGRLRHVSDAFREDPVRILRLARFAARFPGFGPVPETMDLMRQMVAHGEVDALVPERIWQELSRGLMATAPQRMLDVLAQCGALTRMLPTLNADERLAAALARAAAAQAMLPARFALLALACRDERAGHELADALRAPNDCKALADLALRERERLDHPPDSASSTSPDPGSSRSPDPAYAATLLDWLERTDALRRPGRLAMLMQVANAWSGGRYEVFASHLARARDAAAKVDAGAIARPLAKQGAKAIAAALHAARLKSIGEATFVH